ncbi:MAG: hypothetical protein OXC37_02770 [Bdellovibrionaceae bacterium]|nr:hypothetical protein [Pseudobdellovibrionaceae bacterium]
MKFYTLFIFAFFSHFLFASFFVKTEKSILSQLHFIKTKSPVSIDKKTLKYFKGFSQNNKIPLEKSYQKIILKKQLKQNIKIADNKKFDIKSSNLETHKNKLSLIEDKSFFDIKTLNEFFTNNSPLEIHNKALELLKNKNKEPAVLLLKKNFYQNLFPPSYFILNQLKEPVSFSLLLFLTGFIIVSLITLIFFILYLKSFSFFYLKNLLIFLTLFAFLLAGNFFLLKSRVSLIEESYLKLAPVKTAPSTVQIPALKELIVLKTQGEWLKIKSQQQTGWILKQQSFQLF